MNTKFMLQMSQLANAQTGKKITILAAGIAGLVAAYLKTIVNTTSPGTDRLGNMSEQDRHQQLVIVNC